jgi:transcriptional regulator with XRE-family HTH domain
MQTTGKKIFDLRIRRGWTQEDLADNAGVTVRTIQRIETGATQPRLYTLKALASVLGTEVESLLHPDPATGQVSQASPAVEQAGAAPDPVLEKQDNLYLLNLSSFLFLVIPFIHALLPYKIWRRHRSTLYAPGRRIVLFQLKWTITLHGLLLITLIYNLMLVRYFGRAASAWLGNYLWVAAFMYALNAVVILRTAFRIRTGRIKATVAGN